MRIVLVAIGCAVLAGCAAVSPDPFRASDDQSLAENYRLAVLSQVATDHSLLGQAPAQNYTKLALTGLAPR